MSLPEYSLKNKKVVWFFLFVLLAGGALGFVTLGKKEDSTFVIKSASLVCTYPGATPLEVEQLISEPIEREVQSMRLVHKITSESYYGLSKIMVELDPATGAAEIPQLWDELRRKVLNIQPRLPAGASPVTVADDFGDVYGIYYGLSVDGGFTWSELREWAQRIKTALVTVDGVQKVTLFGEQTPVVNVYVSLAALANFSIRPESIVRTIGQQNTIVNSGEKQAGALEIQILEDGAYKDLGDISNQLLISSSGKQYRLGDIARVERGYADPPQTLMRVNGRRAVGIGISTEADVDVVKAGEKIGRVLGGLTRQMPVGMDLTVLYPEDRIAREANSTFILNLAESVAIVILIIMLVMGFRAGVLIGSSLRPNFGNILIELHDRKQTEEVENRFNAYVVANCPDVWLRSSLFKLSPVPDAAIEFGFIGDDIDTLRRLTQAAEDIMWRTPGTANIRNSWGNRVPTWLPLYSQMKGQRIGVTRSQMAQGITIATQGYRLGEYREGDQFMPILLKDENIDAYNLTNLQALPIFTPAGKVYSIEQATDGFRFEYRGGVVKRYNRQRVMKAQCDPARGVNTMELFAALRDSVTRAVPLPEGYSMKVFGEQESQQESNSALAEYMPLTMILIFIVLLLLFRNYREPVIILLMIPLIFIGVVLGLAVTGKVFNFFSLLGLLGLVGMNIKNAVVLVEQIGVLRAEGKGPYDALVSATRSRIVPVAMASGTTILGMLPLLFDSMFGAMAATIMGGLLVATLLTVCVLPVVYAIFYNIRES